MRFNAVPEETISTVRLAGSDKTSPVERLTDESNGSHAYDEKLARDVGGRHSAYVIPTSPILVTAEEERNVPRPVRRFVCSDNEDGTFLQF